jgi:hypothetical protein
MKKIKILFALNILILTLGVFFTECNISPCDCPKVEKPFMLLNAISLKNTDKTASFTPNPAALTKVKPANLLLDIGMLVSLTAAVEQQKNYNPFINSALACSCASEGENGFKNKLAKVEFNVLTDYDADFKKGASFDSKVKITQRFNSGLNLAFKDFIANINTQSGFFPNNFSIEIQHNQAFLDKVNQSSTGIPFALKMTITMVDGTTFSADSDEILLIK